MKVLLFITGYRQLEEYKYFNILLKQLKLNNICDIYIYCNNPDIQNEIIQYYQMFDQKNKHLFITSLNSGFRSGGIEAVSNGIDMGIFKDYDYVIHLHPDVFITDDSYLMDVLLENLNNNIVFFTTKCLPYYERHFAFDFFIFKPKLLLTNIFKEELYSFDTFPEYYFYDMIEKYNIKHIVIKRYDNNFWEPRRIDDNLKLYHEHDLENIVNLLKSRQLL